MGFDWTVASCQTLTDSDGDDVPLVPSTMAQLQGDCGLDLASCSDIESRTYNGSKMTEACKLDTPG